METLTPDLLVIGSGPGGYRAAVLGAMRGLTVAVAERHTWGGTCLNRGCVPKKDWHHSARLIAASHQFDGRGVIVPDGTPLRGDLAQAWRHQHRVVEQVRESYTDYLARLGVVAINGEARFADAGTVAVGDRLVRAGHIIVATGSRPFLPAGIAPLPGRILTTDELFDTPPPPGRQVILAGSGVIGVEMAFILSMLGCRVTWVTRAAPLAHSRFSAPARRVLVEALAAHGIVAQSGARIATAQPQDDGVCVTLEDGTTLQGDWLLLASGRRPNTDGLALAAAGLAADADGFVAVDAQQRTAVPHIRAIGDVCNPVMTANQALADAAVAIADIVAPGSAARDVDAVPELVYSATKLGRIGVNEEEAEDAGFEVATGFAAFETNPRALGQDDTTGFVRLVADPEGGALLGAEIAGDEAGELINLVGAQLRRPDALARLAATRFNHPTRSEEIGNAVEALAAKWGMGDKVFGG